MIILFAIPAALFQMQLDNRRLLIYIDLHTGSHSIGAQSKNLDIQDKFKTHTD